MLSTTAWTFKLCVVLPPPAVMPVSGTVINCSTLLSMIEGGFLIAASVGATLTGMTLIVQIAVPTLSVAAPSLTVKITVRSGAVPP